MAVVETLFWCGVLVGAVEGTRLVLVRWGEVNWGGVYVVTAAFDAAVALAQGLVTWMVLGVVARLPGLGRLASPPLRLGLSAVPAMVLLQAVVYYNKENPGFVLSARYVAPYLAIIAGTALFGLVVGWLCERAAGAGRPLRTLARVVGGAFLGVSLAHAAWGALAGGGRSGDEAAGAAGRPNVVLISIDTLRADHLASYGYAKDTDPNIRRHFRDGLRFESAYAAVPQTRPSHASMLTGRHPAHLGMRHNDHLLPRNVPYLPEVLSENGYQTAAFVAAQPLFGGQSGLDRGFGVYSDVFTSVLAVDDVLAATAVMRVLTRLRLLEVVQRRAGSVTDDVIAWLEDRPPGPFFLFVHYYDPHGRYEPPKAEARAMGVRPDQPLTDRGLTSKARPGATFSDEEKALGRALYDGEILYADRQVGRLLDALEARGLAEETVVILLADHAESLWERIDEGIILTHGRWVDPWDLRVPFFVRGPGVPSGVVHGVTARTEDVMPTLLGLLDVPVPKHLDGRDLLAAARRGEDARMLCFNAPSDEHAPTRLCAKDGTYWYIYEPDTGVESLYRLDDGAEPGARRNVAAEHPELVTQLRESVMALPRPTRDTDSLDAVTREQLKALGYIE
jgi:arylsulfatase A-like enzyme